MGDDTISVAQKQHNDGSLDNKKQNVKDAKADVDGELGFKINIDGISLSVAQKEHKDEFDANKYIQNKVKNYKDAKADVDGELGFKINMDGMSLSVAQKARRPHLDENNYLVFPYAGAQADRDNESGYPSEAAAKDLHEFAQSYINPSTGAMKSTFEVAQAAAAE